MRERQYNTKSLDKALQVIEALGSPEYLEIGIDDLAKSLDIPKGTLMPYLATFERHQWVEQTEKKLWRIAPGLTRFVAGFQKKYNRMVDELKILKNDHLGDDSRAREVLSPVQERVAGLQEKKHQEILKAGELVGAIKAQQSQRATFICS